MENFEINSKGDLVSNSNRKRKIYKSSKLDANMFNIGYYLSTPLIIGVFFGLIADNYFLSKPKGVLIGIVLGTISSFYNLYRLIKNTNVKN
ncbi:MAG: AtpZ/AtpI family protein [bacterium]|nr:AtpZ/AtpI family protein [bacterium]